MKGIFVHVAEDGTWTQVTEGVQALYDLVINSMDWGSGFLSFEDAEPVAALARLADFKDRQRVQDYVDALKHSEEQVVFFRENGGQIHFRGAFYDVYGIKREVPHEHIWSSVGRCMWKMCEVREGQDEAKNQDVAGQNVLEAHPAQVRDEQQI